MRNKEELTRREVVYLRCVSKILKYEYDLIA